MPFKKVITYITVFLCLSCKDAKEDAGFIMTEPFPVEKILAKGTLDVSTFYNTTDYYIYKGITRGFHYDLAEDFANYLGVKVRIVDVNNDVDSAITRLHHGDYDLLAVSMTETPERKEKLNFAQPFFQTDEVLVQNINNNQIKNLSELDGKEVFIQKNAPSKKILQQIQDSLNIHIYVTEVERFSSEDILHLIETGTINYTIIDENIAQASGISMKNLDYSLKLKDNIAVSWVTNPEATYLTEEINNWLQTIRKNGKLNFLYRRYFENHQSVPQHQSKYIMLKKGDISAFDSLLKKGAQELGWDWRLLAAVAYVESRFNPEAESEIGAYGLMQITPETASNYNVTDYFQPDSNVYVSVQNLKYLNNLFKNQIPDDSERIKFILASYNAGAGHVLDAIRLAEKYHKATDKWDGNVDFYLLNKYKPEYYKDPLAKNGYCNGKQSYKFVNEILDTYNNYKHMNK